MRRLAGFVALCVPALVLWGVIARAGAPQADSKAQESRVPVATVDVQDGVRIAVFWDAKSSAPVKKLGQRTVKSDEEFAALLAAVMQDWQKVKKPDVVVSIDAAGEVPWKDLIQVVAACRKAGAKRIEFVTP